MNPISEANPAQAAKAAGLRYVTDARPGIQRKRTGEQFRYTDPDGRRIQDPDVLKRIAALAIPPAYTDVWICPDPNGHLQATGRDARGRKQYRYHPRWREIRDEAKYSRLIAFGEALPRVREQVQVDLAKPAMPREKVLATLVRLLETTMIRVGNEEYARQNKSFGLTTMRNRHVDVEGSTVHFHFRGKSGKKHRIDLKDRKLARIVQRCRELPGQELFEYQDGEGHLHRVHSEDVNDYLREISGQDFTAKDFRTWAGTVLALVDLLECEPFESEAQAKRNIVRTIETVSKKLGNTPSVCRKCYVHPAILEAYLDGALTQAIGEQDGRECIDSPCALRPEETAVLTLLQQRLDGQEARAA